EYSTSFLSALRGKDRLGASIQTSDIDQDGMISLAEAHCHAIETSPTIDLCYRTSDRFLQTQSRLDASDDNLVSEMAPLADLLKMADPFREHSLKRLVEELSLPAEETMKEATRRSKELSSQRRRLRPSMNKADNEVNEFARKMESALLDRWPFLESGWHPQTHALLAHHPEQVVEMIEKHEVYESWIQARKREAELAEDDLNKERQWAKYQRVLLLAKSIARAENLRREGPVEKWDAYQRLLSMENASLRSRANAATVQGN
ncbi:hypothetical protein K2X85_10705, partial [bacterium]|nr:hypothetical protein [bacterium]